MKVLFLHITTNKFFFLYCLLNINKLFALTKLIFEYEGVCNQIPALQKKEGGGGSSKFRG